MDYLSFGEMFSLFSERKKERSAWNAPVLRVKSRVDLSENRETAWKFNNADRNKNKTGNDG